MNKAISATAKPQWLPLQIATPNLFLVLGLIAKGSVYRYSDPLLSNHPTELRHGQTSSYYRLRPSPNTQTLLKTLNDASSKSQCIVTSLSAFETTPEHIIQADVVVIFTPESLSYMSGAIKDMFSFDRCYYPVLEKNGLQVAATVRSGYDGTCTVKPLSPIELLYPLKVSTFGIRGVPFHSAAGLSSP